MTFKDVTAYMVPALENLFGENTWMAAEQLDHLLGRNEYHELINDCNSPHLADVEVGCPIDEGYKQELLMLTGPNAHAILKIIRIRKGLE
jgi:hypothetical protein